MAMMNDDGKLVNTDKELAKVWGGHFHKVLNINWEANCEVMDNIWQRDIMNEFYNYLSWKKFDEAVDELKNNKVGGLKGVPPNTTNTLDKGNCDQVFNFINNFGMAI